MKNQITRLALWWLRRVGYWNSINTIEGVERFTGKRSGELRLVAFTGYGGADDVARAHAAGFDAHLVKPVDMDQLVALLGA